MAKPQKKSAKAKGNATKTKGHKPAKPKSGGALPKAKKKVVNGAAKPAKTPSKKPAKPIAKAATAKPAKKEKPAEKALSTPPVSKIKQNDPFLKKQRERLLQLKDTLLDSMSGVARDSLRSGVESSDAATFDLADAGNDAYDRDFALSLISQEQDALYEIDEALKRIENGTYGMCEMSGKSIPRPRLEALPFTRYTVVCQTELEKTSRFRRVRQPVTSLFSAGDDDSGDDDDDSNNDSKD